MIAAFRLMVALLMLAVGQPLMAHGKESHGTEVENPTVNGMPAAGDKIGASQNALDRDRPVSQHEVTDTSIWTSLHPAMVHFPIGLLLAATLAELIGLARPSNRLTAAVSVLTWGGAAGAVVAVIFGWIHTGLWLGGDATMHWHRWTGTGLAVAAIAAVVLERRSDRRSFRVMLLLIAAVLCAQGYWSGELAHGPNHLSL